MDPERKNKISVKDIADKLKLREFCSGSSDWQIESSGKRTQIAQDLLDRLESDKEMYQSILPNTTIKTKNIVATHIICVQMRQKNL